MSEAVEKGCEKAFTGIVTLEVQDKSNEGQSEQFTFNLKIDKASEKIRECEKIGDSSSGESFNSEEDSNQDSEDS